MNAKADAVKPAVKAKTPVKHRPVPDDLTKNLEFDFCKAIVHASSNKQLDDLASYAIENNSAIALRGHADAIGTYVGNWKMSEKRAIAVKEYLVKKGVAGDKIITTPFGSTLPIATNKTAAGRRHNRRVEIKLQDVKS
ncbi:OmpA family protein [Mucilaginibacter phyllosphaerae]|nr:OmpA family protein [Mucilaginibacter phyllosphaerae]